MIGLAVKWIEDNAHRGGRVIAKIDDLYMIQDTFDLYQFYTLRREEFEVTVPRRYWDIQTITYDCETQLTEMVHLDGSKEIWTGRPEVLNAIMKDMRVNTIGLAYHEYSK